MSKEKDVFYITIASKEGNGLVGYQTVSSTEWEHMDGEKALSHSFLLDSFRKIMGRTLTVIDASVHDKQQNKAMKDLIRGIFSDEIGFASEWAFDQKKLQEMAEEHYKDVDLEDVEAVDIEEVLGIEKE